MTTFVEQVPSHDSDAADATSVFQIGLAAMVPVLGPAIADGWRHAEAKRAFAAQHEYNMTVARRLDALNAAGHAPRQVTMQDLLESQEFLAGFRKMQREALESAAASRQRRLAAAAAQSGDWSRFSVSQRQQFARLAVNLDELHVFLLQYFMNPRDWLEAHGHGEKWASEEFGSGSPLSPFRDIFGEDQTLWGAPVRQAIDDMEQAGLMAEDFDPDHPFSDESYLDAFTSPKGRDFLEYVDEIDHVEALPPVL
ncbi:hypothetical protein MicroSTF_12470 [Microbacterium sp. STF-2]|uniref:hypothetical protein n=1 Tax=Microbacterium sp. STF-2 TaxID=3031132 RepID=UPI002AFE6F91|nr:hypothetical protein [Microbacterium sp. STF-2]MEA1263847.1 hypothetical protein [Microbacterium sp. STF-2]